MSGIVVNYSPKCKHTSFQYDDLTREISCRECEGVLDPVNVIKAVFRYAERLKERIATFKGEMELLKKRKKVKCQHCQRFTDLNLNLSWADQYRLTVETANEIKFEGVPK